MTRRTNLKQKLKDPLRLPREGTKLRRLYDELLSGNSIPAPRKNYSNYVEQLKNFYNCEFETEHVKDYEGKGRSRTYIKLAGRWDGEYFVPVERLDAGL